MAFEKLLTFGRFHRTLLIPMAFALFMIFGAMLLGLPISQSGRAEVSFLDALFISVSAVSVTGMSMFDLGKDFSLFGQLVLLFLIQVGGLGIMTIMALVGIYTGRKIPLQERLLISDSFSLQTPAGMVFLVKKIILLSFYVEFIAGTCLACYFYPMYGWEGVYFGYWHAVSAFTNCGMALLSEDQMMLMLGKDYFVSTVIIICMFLGGVGFLAIDDVWFKRKWSRLTLSTKLILAMEGILIPFGAFMYIMLEGENVYTFGNMNVMEQVQSSVFMSVSSRLAGFALFPLDGLTSETMVFLVMFMFIGGAPVSTGGGVRTTTIAVLVLSLYSWIRGRKYVVIFNKRVESKVIMRASNIFTLAVILTFLTIFSMFLFKLEDFEFREVVFESVAAFSTVGFSTGLTDDWNVACKIILMCAMFIGRIGIMALALTFAERNQRRVRYPTENITVG